jgi:hypothetical protein
LIEVPDLGLEGVWCLDYKVSVVDNIKISVVWKLRNNEEISLNIETEVFVEFSLLWLFWHFISIDDIPLLVDTTVLLVDNNVSVLFIFTT